MVMRGDVGWDRTKGGEWVMEDMQWECLDARCDRTERRLEEWWSIYETVARNRIVVLVVLCDGLRATYAVGCGPILIIFFRHLHAIRVCCAVGSNSRNRWDLELGTRDSEVA